jgi:hypothetical protein
MPTRRALAATFLGLLTLAASPPGNCANRPAQPDYFKIQVVDEATGRGVPLVELLTTNGVRYYTDSNGVVALDEPGFVGQEVFFHVKSHGYELSADMFGFRGKRLRITAGGSAVIRMRRINVAERLYRVTGEGIYRDSVLVGHPAPIKNPLLNAQVTGQDTVMVAPYWGKLYWFWGDTNKLSFPLGHFGTSGATSELPSRGGLDPSVGVDLTYFADKSGFSRPMCTVPGEGMKWTSGLMTVPDESGRERLVGRCDRMKSLGEALERALVIFNDETEAFERLASFGRDPLLYPDSRPFRVRVGDQLYYYFPGWYPLATVRVKADLKHITDPAAYEGFSCLRPGSRYDKAAPALERGSDGRLNYAWKPATEPIGYKQQKELIAAGKMKPEEGWLQLRDIETGAPLEGHTGSVYWNEFRKRWVMIAQVGSGQVWFGEADTPLGPWVYARKIVTHDRYNFYWPGQHPWFDQQGGRLIYFEGTYTSTFSNAPFDTPRYDYNQVMYRLRLDDTRLVLPVAVYELKPSGGNRRYETGAQLETAGDWGRIERVAFFAPDRPRDGLTPIYAHRDGALSGAPPSSASTPLFYALLAEAPPPDPVTGKWVGKIKELDDMPFNLDLQRNGERITGTADLLVIQKGEFKQGRLYLELSDEEDTYALTAVIQQDKMTGRWKSVKAEDTGEWSAERAQAADLQSPDIAPLYEYRDSTGAGLYSADPAFRAAGFRRSARPLCRVWRNPMSLLILDRDAKPVK